MLPRPTADPTVASKKPLRLDQCSLDALVILSPPLQVRSVEGRAGGAAKTAPGSIHRRARGRRTRGRTPGAAT